MRGRAAMTVCAQSPPVRAILPTLGGWVVIEGQLRRSASRWTTVTGGLVSLVSRTLPRIAVWRMGVRPHRSEAVRTLRLPMRSTT
jgi:hypothetical protein